jgi:hypothetical protein
MNPPVTRQRDAVFALLGAGALVFAIFVVRMNDHTI